MKKIKKITLKRVPDYDADLSYLGTFDPQAQSDYAIAHEPDNNRTFNWFNPQNVEGDTPRNLRKYAKQDYERMMAYENGHWHMMMVKAEAEIATSEKGNSWLINKVSSGGLWGLESDSDESYFKEVEDEQMAELKDLLLELGFTAEDIAKAPKESEV